MKRIRRDLSSFSLLRAMDDLARQQGLPIRESTTASAIFPLLASRFARQQEDDKLFHGQRAESMFAYVASALGKCRIIKSEDAGEIFSSDDLLRTPDYRLVLEGGQQLLIEVKNCHHSDPSKPLKLRMSDIEGLGAYATAFSCELLIAVYWSRWKSWTLLRIGDLKEQGQHYTVSMIEAMAKNQMYRLGDRTIATIPALSLRLVNSPDVEKSVDQEGRHLFKLAAANLYCGTDRISEKLEERITWFLMNYGAWKVLEAPAEIEGGRLSAMTFIVAPRERANPDQEFEVVGALSELVSRQYDDVTTDSGAVTRISPTAEPSEFGVLIPEDFKGTALRLWQFELHPPAPTEDFKADSD
jgi:Holliday junction resolvase